MAKPGVLVLTGYGINCEEETKLAFELAGGNAEVIHINDLIENKNLLDDAKIFVFPGGFSYGDDTGSGKAMASKILNNLSEEFNSFLAKDVLLLGICNGFQVMTNLGIVPGYGEIGRADVALDYNLQNRYECRWVNLKLDNDIFFKGIDYIRVPVAHGEGNFFADEETLKNLKDNKQITAVYCDSEGNPANGEFPLNPNGSLNDIASISDKTGRFLGMMPHPERNIFFSQRDSFTIEKENLIREGKDIPEYSDGLKIFQNAIDYFK